MSDQEELLKIAKIARSKGDHKKAKAALLKLEQISSVEQTPTIEAEQPGVIDRIGRQVGLTARHGIEGVAEVADIVTNPIRAGLNQIPGANFDQSTSQLTTQLLDEVGLPKPQNNAEELVGTASKFLAGGGGFIKGGQVAANAANATVGGVGKALASAPAQQGISAASAGAAGEYAKQDGADAGGQILASILGGLTPVGIQATARGAANKGAQYINTAADDVAVNSFLDSNGVDISSLPLEAINTIKASVSDAMKTGSVDKTALARLADYAKTNATPTKATVSLDPVEVTQQKNLAKIGASSDNPDLQKLSRVENENNAQLIDGLNDLGAGAKNDSYATGAEVIDAVSGKNNVLKTEQKRLYNLAKDTEGRSLPLNRAVFSRRVDELLKKENKHSFLPAEVKAMVNEISYGEVKKGVQTFDTPFNVDTIDQLETILATAGRSTHDGNVKSAISLVKQALIETPIEGAASDQSMKAFRAAREFSRKMYKWQESSPAIKAIVDGVEPDRFMDKYIIGSSASFKDVGKLSAELANKPGAKGLVKNQIAGWLKGKALNGKADEVGILSHTNLGKALDSIGDRKLRLFFSKQELNQLKAIQRVASYEQFQPKGSAVNNSNTATSATGMLLNWTSKIAEKIPFGKAAISDPINARQNATNGRQALKPDLGGKLSRESVPIAPAIIYGSSGATID